MFIIDNYKEDKNTKLQNSNNNNNNNPPVSTTSTTSFSSTNWQYWAYCMGIVLSVAAFVGGLTYKEEGWDFADPYLWDSDWSLGATLPCAFFFLGMGLRGTWFKTSSSEGQQQKNDVEHYTEPAWLTSFCYTIAGLTFAIAGVYAFFPGFIFPSEGGTPFLSTSTEKGLYGALYGAMAVGGTYLAGTKGRELYRNHLDG